MTDCDKFMENKDLTKVVYRKRGAKREQVRGEKKRGGESIFKACTSLR